MSACNHSGHNEASPNVSDEEPVENGLAKEGSTQPKQPAGSDQINDSCEEDEIAHLLAAVVTTLRRNFNRSERNLEETTRITAEISEPHNSVFVPLKKILKGHGKTFGSEENIAHEVKGEESTQPEVPNHHEVSGFIGNIAHPMAEINDGTGDDQGVPANCVDGVENFVGSVEAQNSCAFHFGIRHVLPPS